MNEQATREPSREEAIAAYKRLLQAYVDRRPSGMRQKIALALGKHKSFVSQITNPAYPGTVPARHLGTIFDICHFSPDERASFLAAYRVAHPKGGQPTAPEAADNDEYVIQIRLPKLRDPRQRRALEDTIRQTANRIIALVSGD